MHVDGSNVVRMNDRNVCSGHTRIQSDLFNDTGVDGDDGGHLRRHDVVSCMFAASASRHAEIISEPGRARDRKAGSRIRRGSAVAYGSIHTGRLIAVLAVPVRIIGVIVRFAFIWTSVFVFEVLVSFVLGRWFDGLVRVGLKRGFKRRTCRLQYERCQT